MTVARSPQAGSVLWEAPQAPIGPHHCFLELHQPDRLEALQGLLRDRGLPPLRLLPQYRRFEGDRLVMQGLCLCYRDSAQHWLTSQLGVDLGLGGESTKVTTLKACAAELGVELVEVSTQQLAEFFCLNPDARWHYVDHYHWNPWAHAQRIQEVNALLLRFGLPARKSLALPKGQTILGIVVVYEEMRGEVREVTVRYAVEDASQRSGYTWDARYPQCHEVLLCVCLDQKIPIEVRYDHALEREIWRFPMVRLARKPTNSSLRAIVAPTVPSAKCSVLALGDHLNDRGKQAYRLIRLQSTQADALALTPTWNVTFEWKSWEQIVDALDQGRLDASTELMVTRVLRRYARSGELFQAA